MGEVLSSLTPNHAPAAHKMGQGRVKAELQGRSALLAFLEAGEVALRLQAAIWWVTSSGVLLH